MNNGIAVRRALAARNEALKGGGGGTAKRSKAKAKAKSTAKAKPRAKGKGKVTAGVQMKQPATSAAASVAAAAASAAAATATDADAYAASTPAAQRVKGKARLYRSSSGSSIVGSSGGGGGVGVGRRDKTAASNKYAAVHAKKRRTGSSAAAIGGGTNAGGRSKASKARAKPAGMMTSASQGTSRKKRAFSTLAARERKAAADAVQQRFASVRQTNFMTSRSLAATGGLQDILQRSKAATSSTTAVASAATSTSLKRTARSRKQKTGKGGSRAQLRALMSQSNGGGGGGGGVESMNNEMVVGEHSALAELYKRRDDDDGDTNGAANLRAYVNDGGGGGGGATTTSTSTAAADVEYTANMRRFAYFELQADEGPKRPKKRKDQNAKSNRTKRRRKSNKYKDVSRGTAANGSGDIDAAAYAHDGDAPAATTAAAAIVPVTRQQVLQEMGNYVPPNMAELDAIVESYRLHARKWLIYLEEGFNLLFYGAGSKQCIIRNFVADNFNYPGVNVTTLNGEVRGHPLRPLLRCFTANVLHSSRTFSTSEAELEFIVTTFAGGASLSGEQHVHVPDHCILAISNLDGPALRDMKVQDAISQLAAVRQIHVVATVDNVHAALLWDLRMKANLNFVWCHTPTYATELPAKADVKTRSMRSRNKLTERGDAMAGIGGVLQSVTAYQRKIYRICLDFQLDDGIHADVAAKGIGFKALLERCEAEMLVSGNVVANLRAKLVQLWDHGLIVEKRSEGGVVRLPIPYGVDMVRAIRALLDEIESAPGTVGVAPAVR